MSTITQPESLTELIQRANHLAGLSLADLAEECDFTLPTDFQHHKGWLGNLLELALGASAGSQAKPDFPDLGVELKTIPVNEQGKPIESTFVCAVAQKLALQWHDSLVWHKLQRVLWVPIAAKNSIPERCIGQPVLWQPNAQQQAILKQDWQELTDMLAFGEAAALTAKYGEALHVRPKAANSRVLKMDINQNGEQQKIVPRGFYLRTSFTREILSR